MITFAPAVRFLAGTLVLLILTGRLDSAPPMLKYVGGETLPNYVIDGKLRVVEARGLHVTEDYYYVLGITCAKPALGPLERCSIGLAGFGKSTFEPNVKLRRVILMRVPREHCVDYLTADAILARSLVWRQSMPLFVARQLTRLGKLPDFLATAMRELVRIAFSSVDHEEWIDITPSSKELPASSDGESFYCPGSFDIDSKGNLWIPITAATKTLENTMVRSSIAKSVEGPSIALRIKIASDGPLRQLEREVVFTAPSSLTALFCEVDQEAILGLTGGGLLQWSRQGKLKSNRPSSLGQSAMIGVYRSAPNSKVALLSGRYVIGGGWFPLFTGRPVSWFLDRIEVSGDKVHGSGTWQIARRNDVESRLLRGAVHGREGSIYLLFDDIGRGAKVLRYETKHR